MEEGRMWAYIIWPVTFVFGVYLMLGRLAIGLIDRVDEWLNKWDTKGANC
jgi:hypothetical protein